MQYQEFKKTTNLAFYFQKLAQKFGGHKFTRSFKGIKFFVSLKKYALDTVAKEYWSHTHTWKHIYSGIHLYAFFRKLLNFNSFKNSDNHKEPEIKIFVKSHLSNIVIEESNN